MGSALCSKCLGEYFWHARRGSRLADTVSPCCGVAGMAMRADKRRSAFLTVERFGSLERPERWAWTVARLWVYLLATEDIQLDNRAIYRPAEQYADALYCVYVGSDPFMQGYRLRMRARDFDDLRREPVVAVTGGIGPFGMIAVGIPAHFAPDGDWPSWPPDLITGEGGTAE